MHPNALLIEQFYLAFAQADAETMAAAYAPDAQFSDPVFPHLSGNEIGDMWRMLTCRAQDFSLIFDGIHADDSSGRAHWVATYTFSQTGRTVVNDIHASFVFRDGKIIRHRDHFSFWRWGQQALGLRGLLLGWTPLVRRVIQKKAAQGLTAFRAKK